MCVRSAKYAVFPPPSSWRKTHISDGGRHTRRPIDSEYAYILTFIFLPLPELRSLLTMAGQVRGGQHSHPIPPPVPHRTVPPSPVPLPSSSPAHHHHSVPQYQDISASMLAHDCDRQHSQSDSRFRSPSWAGLVRGRSVALVDVLVNRRPLPQHSPTLGSLEPRSGFPALGLGGPPAEQAGAASYKACPPPPPRAPLSLLPAPHRRRPRPRRRPTFAEIAVTLNPGNPGLHQRQAHPPSNSIPPSTEQRLYTSSLGRSAAFSFQPLADVCLNQSGQVPVSRDNIRAFAKIVKIPTRD
jgi:hypothetical protein